MSRCQCCLLGLCMHLPLQTTKTEDVRSLALPGSYSEKITHLGRSLLGFTRIKHLDLSRNAIESLEVTPCMLIVLCLFKTHSAQLKKKTKACKFEVQVTYIWALYIYCVYDQVDSPLQGLDHLKHLETLNLYPSSNICSNLVACPPSVADEAWCWPKCVLYSR